jgi:hypothetical protein
MQSEILRDILPLSLELESNPSRQQARSKQQAERSLLLLLACLAYSLTLKIDAEHPSETPVNFY